MLKSILKFARIRILVTCYAIAFVGSAASGAVTHQTLLTILILVTWYIHAASSNDYADRHIDQINLKEAIDRPLVAKNISFKQLWLIHHTAGFLAVVLSSFYGLGAVIFTLSMLVLDYAYSYRPMKVSNRGIFSQLLLAFAYVYFPLSLGYWSVGTGDYPWLLSFGLYVAFVGRLLLKDFRDVKGDKKHGKLTFLLRHGVKRTCVVSGLFGLLSLVIMLVAINFSLGIAVVLIASQVLALNTLRVLAVTDSIPTQLVRVSYIAQLANSAVIALLAYLLTRNQVTISELELQLIPGLVGGILLVNSTLSYRGKAYVKSAQ